MLPEFLKTKDEIALHESYLYRGGNTNLCMIMGACGVAFHPHRATIHASCIILYPSCLAYVMHNYVCRTRFFLVTEA